MYVCFSNCIVLFRCIAVCVCLSLTRVLCSGSHPSRLATCVASLVSRCHCLHSKETKLRVRAFGSLVNRECCCVKCALASLPSETMFLLVQAIGCTCKVMQRCEHVDVCYLVMFWKPVASFVRAGFLVRRMPKQGLSVSSVHEIGASSETHPRSLLAASVHFLIHEVHRHSVTAVVVLT
jgi:hypothetical protein